MIKAVTITLGLTLLLAASPAAYAQAPTPESAQQAAVDTAVHNEANRILLRQKLDDARKAQERGELVAAAKSYDAAWDLVQTIGRNNVEAEAGQTRVGLTVVRMELAKTAQKHNDLEGAQIQVSDVLRVDKTNAEAQAFRRENEKLLAEQAGRMPSKEVQRMVPGIMTNKVNASTLVHDGMLLYQMGKLDEAQIKLHEAAKLDPQNQAAYYYLNLVAEARYHDALNHRDIDSRERAMEVEREWALPVEGQSLPQPNPYNGNTMFSTGKGRQAIFSKLGRIRLDEIKYEGLPLSEVVISLNDQAKKRDSEKRGINFIIDPNVDTSAAAPSGPTAIDPTTGLPVAPTGPSEGVDISTASIKLSLNDVSLADALDAIIKVANIPIKYSVVDYAVIFSHKGSESPQLFTRQYKIDPNTFVQGLQGVSSFIFGQTSSGSGQSGGGQGGGGGFGGGGGGGGGQSGSGGQQSIPGAIIPRVEVAPGGGGGGGGGGLGGGGGGGSSGGVMFLTKTNATVAVSEMARAYFTALGVPLDPPKSVFFNDREGRLYVRATMQDLDTIEEAIHVLNTVPDQINIKAKFVEVAQNDTKAFGFDWFLGNVLMNKGSLGLQGGTAPSYNGAPSPANPSGVFPGNAAAGTTIPASSSDQLVTGGLRNSASSLFTLTGILTDPQFRVVLHALDQRNGSDVLAAPEVTTISGRQAQMKATEIKTVIVDFSFNQAVGGVGGGGGGFPSDRNIKKDFAQVDAQEVLAKVAAMPITEWSYTAEGPTRHIGPMAQDFRAAFQLGTDDRHIATVDAAGVALAAIKGLNEKNQKLEAQVKAANSQMQAKEHELQTLKQRLDRLEQILTRLDK